jgi:hypothetical protein
MKQKQNGPAAGGRPASRANKGSASRKGAKPAKNKTHPLPERKLRPVPIAVALRRVNPDTQLAYVMERLTDGPDWTAMNVLSRISGSLNIHCVVAAIRKRFHWVIENFEERHGKKHHSYYRLVKPQL